MMMEGLFVCVCLFVFQGAVGLFFQMKLSISVVGQGLCPFQREERERAKVFFVASPLSGDREVVIE
jgi:hypothetical protein